MAKTSTTAVDFDEWPLSNALWMKFCNTHGKYKPELNEYFHMYWYQLKFALFCVTSALGISWQHFNHPNLLVHAVYRFHVYFHVRLKLCDLFTPLPHEGGFAKVKNGYTKSACYSTCDGYGVNADKTWMFGDWFYMTGYGVFGHEVKTTKRSPPNNLMHWIITQSKGFTRKGIEKITKSVMTYVYLVLIFQIQTRSTMVCNSALVVDAQQVLKSTFKLLIKKDIGTAIDIKRCKGVLGHALLKVDFSVRTGICIPID